MMGNNLLRDHDTTEDPNVFVCRMTVVRQRSKVGSALKAVLWEEQGRLLKSSDMADNKHRVDPIELWTVVKEVLRACCT